VILSDDQLAEFLDTVETAGYQCIDRALEGIRSENATASRQADLESIRELVQSTPGGFELLNSTVRQRLAQWFVEQGAIRTSVRMVGRGSSSIALGDSFNGGAPGRFGSDESYMSNISELEPGAPHELDGEGAEHDMSIHHAGAIINTVVDSDFAVNGISENNTANAYHASARSNARLSSV
jgi:hypothetical protein